MTEEQTDTQVAELISSMEAEAKAKSKTAQEGELLAETNIGGMPMRLNKQSSMVRKGNVALPERVRFYRSDNGTVAWLPTVQLVHHLSKTHADGVSVFVKEQPEEFRNVKKAHGPCWVCRNKKRFTTNYDFVTHMENKHPRELRIKKEEDEKESGNFIQVLMAMSPEERNAVKALLGGDNGNPQVEQPAEGPLTTARCEDCGWEGKPVSDTTASLRTHRNTCKGTTGVPASVGAGQGE